MRIQKILSERGVASRRAAEKMIEEGRVTVNGKRALLGQSADAGQDKITVDGRPLPPAPKPVYIILHKPRGVVTTLSDDKGRATVKELVADVPARLVPVGRLDYDSEGLLIMTNDGELVHSVTHPSKKVDKRYLVRVRGQVIDGVNRMNRPLVLDGKKLPKSEVRIVEEGDDRGLLEVVIHTGVNRQVRRMCEMAGLRVSRLKRVAVGQVLLGDLKPGKWRSLTSVELNYLKSLDRDD